MSRNLSTYLFLYRAFKRLHVVTVFVVVGVGGVVVVGVCVFYKARGDVNTVLQL